MATQDFNPAAGENSPIDGFVGRTGVNSTWALIRSGAGNMHDDTGTTLLIRINTQAAASNYFELDRGIILFDVSGFAGLSADITGITLNLYVANLSGGFGTISTALSLVNSTPASNSILADSDYGQVGTTRQATDIADGSITSGQWIQFTLNATGIATVKAALPENLGTGIVKLGLRYKEDVDNVDAWVSDKDDFIQISSGDSSSNKPYLEITYTGAIAYTIDVSVGAFILTGINVLLEYAQHIYEMIVSVGQFSLTGVNVLLNRGYMLGASVSQFILTGINVNIIPPFNTVWNLITKSVSSWVQKTISNTNWTIKPPQ